MTETKSFMLDRDDVLRQVRSLPSLPAVVIELLQTLDDDTTDMQALADKLAYDQALSAKVLRVANSSFYGLQGKIESITDAIVVLGLQGIRTLATAAAVTSAFVASDRSPLDFRQFWRHSIAVALCAKEIARLKRMNEGNAFAAGLLHDIGRLALASCFPQHFAAVARAREAADSTWLAVEREMLGIDHAEIGQVLTEYWRFPPLLISAIGTHHSPAVQQDPLAALVHVADAIGHALDLSGEPEAQVPLLQDAAWQATGLGEAQLQQLLATVEAQHAAACESLVS